MSKYEIELKPFNVPNYVIPIMPVGKRQDGFIPTQGIPIKDIPIETLEEMCKEFTDSVLAKSNE